MTSEPLLIRPSTRWKAVDLRELWEFRDLLVILGGRDIKLRYRQTALGVGWVVFQPLLGAAIFAFLFGRVARLDSQGTPYFVFALIGMVSWGGFSSTLTRASGSLVSNAALVSKVSFPRLILPLSTTLPVALDLLVGVCLVALGAAIHGVIPSWRMLTLPIWLFLLLALALGLGLFASALTVRYRDIQHVLPVLVQLGFYATPVAYSVNAIPERYRAMLLLNPVASLMEAARWSVLGQGDLPLVSIGYTAVLTAGSLLGGALFFRQAERAFADVI